MADGEVYCDRKASAALVTSSTSQATMLTYTPPLNLRGTIRITIEAVGRTDSGHKSWWVGAQIRCRYDGVTAITNGPGNIISEGEFGTTIGNAILSVDVSGQDILIKVSPENTNSVRWMCVAEIYGVIEDYSA